MDKMMDFTGNLIDAVTQGRACLTSRHQSTRRRCAPMLGVLLASIAISAGAGAQSAKDSASYVQAQQMVANGDAVNGRKLADSVAATAQPGSAAYAEGLFWRATVAANARDSEHEYRQIIVDYPLSGRVPDALLRIGQLESARGENAAALQHFQRLVLEHPLSPLRAEASYWVARMYFESNDAPHACVANADALATVSPANVELRNRIDFQQQRCRGVTLATDDAAAPVATSTKTAASRTIPVKSESARATSAKLAADKAAADKAAADKAAADKAAADKAAADKAAADKAVADRAARAESVSRSGSSGSTGAPRSATDVVSRQPTKAEVARALASAEQPVSSKASKASSTATASKARAGKSSTKSREPSSASGAGGSYAVQVAAFPTRAPASQLAAKLHGRGYITYVDGTSAPYRVRIGHYSSHAAAAAELVKLKAKHIDGFVVER